MNSATRRRGLVVAALAAALASLAAACSGGSASRGLGGTTAPGTGAPTGSLVVGLDGDPPGLDPAGNFLALSALSVGNAIYDRLMVANSGSEPRPLLAESLTEAADRLSWTLELRDGITFSDGTPLDAAAVVTNLDRQKASQINGSALAPVERFEALDADTVRISLSQPWVALPSVLAGIQGIMASPKAIDEEGAAFARKPVGTGPYVLSEWVSDDRIVVVRNPNYWGEPKPTLERITFKLIPDEGARFAALQAGDVDAITALLPETARKAETEGRFTVVRPPIAGQTAIYLNNGIPPFDDVRARRAALLAVDLDAFAQAFGGQPYAEYAWGAFPKGSPWYEPPAEPLRHDPEEARRLVAQYEADTGKRLSFTYRTVAASQTLSDSGRALVKAWQDVGMDATAKPEPDTNTLVLSMVFRQYQAAGLVAAYAFDPDTTVYDLYHSGRTLNLSGYSSDEMDALLETGRTSNNRAVRRDAYAKVQRLARIDVPLIHLSFGTIFVIADRKVTGVEPSGHFPAKTVGLAG
jgi:peptide/nickel transport system substrate-binding protein